jgi:hypothetical protein
VSNFATRAGLTLSRDDLGRLVLTDSAGVRHTGVEPVRAFPLSEPRQWIALVDVEGRELATVSSPDELGDATRKLLEAELTRREFLPVIERIVDVTSNTEPTEWTVHTDRGPTKFFVEGSDAFRRLDADRCLIVDLQGVRYLIPDRKRLDVHSRKLLDHYF